MVEILKRTIIRDERGHFLKVLHGTEEGLPLDFGEIYLIKGVDGACRANHYHELATEWFTPVVGKVRLNLHCLASGLKSSIILDAESPETVVVKPRVAHTLVGDISCDYILLAYSDHKYKPDDTIAVEPIILP